MEAKHYLAIGLMSGTSLDGIDASLIKTDGSSYIEPLGFHTFCYPEAFKKKLMMAAKVDVPLSDLLRLEKTLTQYHTQAVQTLCTQEKVDAARIQLIGFHGQTIRHLPEEGLTWQLGNPHALAASTGIDVVTDFRRYDMALGGQGAPLAPLYHAMLLKNEKKPVAVLNLGGVANITYLNAKGEVLAGDVGPGCTLLDKWAMLKLGQPYDENGKHSLKGEANYAWVQHQLKNTPFFHKPLPKSADRYDFDLCLPPDDMPVNEGFASLCMLSALCVGHTFKTVGVPMPPLWLAGGGARNAGLVAALKTQVPSIHFFETLPLLEKSHAYHADRVEADCFAWLGIRRFLGLPTTAKTTTGARMPSSGGSLIHACTF